MKELKLRCLRISEETLRSSRHFAQTSVQFPDYVVKELTHAMSASWVYLLMSLIHRRAVFVLALVLLLSGTPL